MPPGEEENNAKARVERKRRGERDTKKGLIGTKGGEARRKMRN